MAKAHIAFGKWFKNEISKKNQILVISYDNFISPFLHIQSTFLLPPPFQNIIHNQENLKIFTIPYV
jgi:hypothetical protein